MSNTNAVSHYYKKASLNKYDLHSNDYHLGLITITMLCRQVIHVQVERLYVANLATQ
jgi:hypothetical protein